MPLIKLDAIDSTNDYLKQLSKVSTVENYTVVIANEQTNGKGQMGAKWFSEKGKNLTMSILIKSITLKSEEIFALNTAVTLSLLDVLKTIRIPNITVKWPNDIMSDSKKVAGVLIENSFKSNSEFSSIVGIGLNLNQTNFDTLPQATSLSCISGEIYESEDIALLIRDSLKRNIEILSQNSELLWTKYHQNLYKLNYPSAFEDKMGNRFMGIIQKVTSSGKLQVLHEDDSLVHYEVKEIKMLH